MIDPFLWRRSHREMIDAVSDVARAIRSPENFESSAKQVAEQFGHLCLKLPRRFLKPPKRPPEFHHKNVVTAFGDWLIAWYSAILEVLYNVGSPALHVVREIAFGAYDWPQANAVVVLCRWALDGMDREHTVYAVARRLPTMRNETLETVAAQLAFRAKKDLRFGEIVDTLRSAPEFDEVWQELSQPAAD